MPNQLSVGCSAFRVERAVCDHRIFRHRGCLGDLLLDGDLLLQEVGLKLITPTLSVLQSQVAAVGGERFKAIIPAGHLLSPWDVGLCHLVFHVKGCSATALGSVEKQDLG